MSQLVIAGPIVICRNLVMAGRRNVLMAGRRNLVIAHVAMFSGKPYNYVAI